MIELVFEFEIGLTRSVTFGARGILFGESCDVTTGAEGFGAGTADYDYTGQLRFLPFLENSEVQLEERGRQDWSVRTLSLDVILRAMEPLRELSFLGRLSSMVRTP